MQKKATIILLLILYFIIATCSQQNTPQYQQQSQCVIPTNMTCPPQQYCQNASLIVISAVTYYDCDEVLNVSADTVQLQGGYFYGGLYIQAAIVQIAGAAEIIGNFTVNFTTFVNISQATLKVSNNIMMLPQYQINGRLGQNGSALISISNSAYDCKKIFMYGTNISIQFSQITTKQYTCLYRVLNISQFMRLNRNLSVALSTFYTLPINVIIAADDTINLANSTISTTIIGIVSNNTFANYTVITTSNSSCSTNLGQGKGLDAQMSTGWYCGSGASSSGYGTLSNANCSDALQYFMFLAHAFPYLSKGPYLSTGSGGYGYNQQLGTQGAGGGIIFLFSTQQFYSYQSQFLANGGYIGENYNVSAGSGGTVFLYTDLLAGNISNFSAAGGAAYNNNGSGAGGIVKISYNQMNFSIQNSMWINVSVGYQQSLPNMTLQTNGIFYGPICPPGEFVWYLSCHPCPYGTFSVLGDTACQVCPRTTKYLPNKDTSLQNISNISLCFSQRNQTFIQIWIQPSSISWLKILLYIATLLLTAIIGLLIKKKYKKKLTVMETQSFSLDNAQLDVQQTRILTQNLKIERNIKFQDLMYHIHRITLFGSNNPQCPWALPEFPPEQIKQYILRQGFIDFSIKFNKVATWTGFQKFIFNLTFLLYPLHWFYYDKVKKTKYKKLLALVQESKQFNLINNFDFEDKNMVTIKISKNTDYTICYLDFMVYDRADTKYFNLSSPFIISISGEGNFLRPFYLQDRDVFFNTLFYIVNKAQQKIEKQEDEKKQLFINIVSQKKKQENRNKLIDFLKRFNTISITLDLSAPLNAFINTLISLIDYIATWNETYFRQFGIQLDLILMISKVKKGHVVSNQIHILTNKYPQLFKEFMHQNIPKMNRYQKYDLKLGLFVYNPDQQIKKVKNRRSTANANKFKRSWVGTEIGQIGQQRDEEQQQISQNFVEQVVEVEEKEQKKKKFKIVQNCVRIFNFIRYMLMTHRKLEFDKDLTKFAITVVILFQCLLAFVWSVELQFPYLTANLISPFIGILWMVSGSYGIGKLFLIFNAMALLDQFVTLTGYFIYYINRQYKKSTIVQFVVCEVITIGLRLVAIPLTTKFLSVTRKLSTSKMFK